MLVIDLAILVGLTAIVALAAGAVGGRVLGDRAERRRREAQGAKNAAAERRRLEEKCVVCGEPIDHEVDLWERGEWWHRRCWRESVND